MGKDNKGNNLGKGISQDKSGKYRVRLKVSSDFKIDRNFDTLREAKSFLETARYEMAKDMPISDRSTTVNELYYKFIAHKLATNKAENTIRNYNNRYFFNIKDAIGTMRVVDVKPMHIQAVLNNMKSDYMTSTIKQTYDTMRGLFWFAVANDFISDSPVTKGNIVEIPEGEETKVIDFFSVEEQRHFLQVAKDLAYFEQFALMLLTGMRVSEVVGLTWSCVDLEKRTITIDKVLEYRYQRRKDAELEFEKTNIVRMRKSKNGKDVPADGWRWGKPKTARSKRVINISEQVVELLKGLQDRPYLREDTPEEFRDLVFLCKKTGMPVRSNTYDNAIRKRIDIMTSEINTNRKAQGFAPIAPHYLSCHDFRHTYATRFIESAKDANYAKMYKFLSKSLGHSSISITLDLYSHLTEESEMELMNDFGEYMAQII